MALPIIDRSTLKLALKDLLDPEMQTAKEDFRDLLRILANLPADDVRNELEVAIRAKLTESAKACAFCGQTEGHSKRCSVTKFGVDPQPPTLTEPKFEAGDRVFSHYVMAWGTVESVSHTTEATTHGVTGSPLPSSTWYRVKMDGMNTELLDDGGGNWDLARIVPPEIAARYGYGQDPKAK